MNRVTKHLTPGTAIACIALFVALSGAAFAAKTTLGQKAVKTQNLANAAVTTAKLRNGAVATGKIRNGAITTPKIADGAVGATQIANGAVRAGQLGGQVVTEPKIKNGAVSESKLGSESVTTGKIKKEAVTAATLSAGLYGQLVRNVSYVSKESGAVSATSPQSVTAECPAGREAIGGGARIVPGDATVVDLTETIPFVSGDGKRTGWTATAKTSEATKTFAVEAFAVCAEL